jgi:hypothetical protein
MMGTGGVCWQTSFPDTFFFFFFVVLGFELRPYTLNHSASHLDFFEIGSQELFSQGVLRSSGSASCIARMTGVSHRLLASRCF